MEANAAASMKRGFSLSTRLTGLVGVMLLASAGIIAATLWVTSSQKADGVIINVAGRVRGNSQRFIKAALACAMAEPSRAPHDPQAGNAAAGQPYQAEVAAARTVVNQSLTALLEGGAVTVAGQEVLIPRCDDQRIRAQLTAVAELWKSVEADGLRLAEGGNPPDAAYRSVLTNLVPRSEKIFAEAEKMAAMFQAVSEAKVKTLKAIQYPAGVLVLLAFAGVIFYVRYKVCVPVNNALAVADAIIAGDLSQRCTIKTSDEIGQLAWRLNQAVDAIDKMLRLLQREITDREQVEADLVKAKLAAETADRAKSEFLANMSHEIRTPMTAILGFTDLLLEHPDGPEAVEAGQTIQRNGRHLLQLINDILDLSKIEAGKLELKRVPCSPSRILANVVSLMKVCADAKGLRLELNYASAIPKTIVSDPIRLQQILINLVGNAIKFTEVGSVRLVARQTQGPDAQSRWQCDVIDTGIGMSPEQVARLFQRFSQADSSMSRRFGGTGLGLAISKRLVDSLGGDILVTSAPARGSTFTLSVPCGPLERTELVDLSLEPLPAAGCAPPGRDNTKITLSGRILLVEDSPDNQRLIAFLLRKAGAEVTVAENGQEALHQVAAAKKAAEDSAGAQRGSFDLILMDMQMLVMNGYEATRRLRQEGCHRPIVALTAHASTGDVQKCLDAGCDDYLSKPIQREKFLARVALHLGETTLTRSAPCSRLS